VRDELAAVLADEPTDERRNLGVRDGVADKRGAHPGHGGSDVEPDT
jgi:hypothetical protein